MLKSHHVPTMDRAWWASRIVRGVSVYGSLVLNDSVGGINPAAVAVALQHNARIIWLPTLSAANHLNRKGVRGGLVVARRDRVTRAVSEILDLIAQRDVALATGHISLKEIRPVLKAAVRAGVRRIIVTHPEHSISRISLDDQRELLDIAPVFFERCVWQPDEHGRMKPNAEINLAAIKAMGAAGTVISSDAGEAGLPDWTVLLGEHLAWLSRQGVCAVDLKMMTTSNPGFLLGLNTKPSIAPAGIIQPHE